MTIYETRDGDMLDAVCFRYYGYAPKAVEAVLEANPKLADLGPTFRAGVSIALPDLPAPSAEATTRLWD